MLSRMVSRITSFFLIHKIIADSDTKFFEYSMLKLLSSTITVIISLALGFILRMPWETIAFLICFYCLKTHTGGYHASSPESCIITFQVIYLVNMLIFYPLLIKIESWIVLVVLTVSFIVILLLAPVNHPNVNWRANEIPLVKKKVIVVVLVELITILLLLLFVPQMKNMCLAAVLSIMSVAVLILFAKLMKQEVKVNEGSC